MLSLVIIALVIYTVVSNRNAAAEPGISMLVIVIPLAYQPSRPYD